MVKALVAWMNQRLGSSRLLKAGMKKVFPDHWSFMLGEIALYSFVVLLATGVYLTMFFVPDASHKVIYQGSYSALQGVEMSPAYESTIRLSFDIREGLLIRQIHHWAALVFIAAIVIHLLRIFFTGAFRKPREVNWIIGVTLLVLAIVNGFAGYSLPDDLLSGTGLRIAYSITQSVPIIGPWTASLMFGGPYPSGEIIPRLYTVHILLVPGLIIALVGAHIAILVRQKHTQFPGPGRTEHNVVGSPMWPKFMAKTIGLLLIVAATLALLGGVFQINPVWFYGPYHPAQVSAPAQPDWYMGWLEGALRLFPNWEIRLFGFTIPNVFFPGALLPGLTFGALYAWPFIEARFTRDREMHNLLDRPSDRPWRSAFGVGALTFFVILFVAGSNDVIASRLEISLNALTHALRALVLTVPFLAGAVAYWIARERGSGPRVRPARREFVRTEDGGYEIR
jgi:ubiquinol-cytochrome c reductase cytochrome b subunit